MDILGDGTLDLDDETLAGLDVVVASVHGGFEMGEAAMTERIITAMENPNVQILGHPTGRKLGAAAGVSRQRQRRPRRGPGTRCRDRGKRQSRRRLDLEAFVALALQGPGR